MPTNQTATKANLAAVLKGMVSDYDPRPVLHMVNPQSGPARYREQKWLFSFGPYGLHLLVWDRYLEGALETAADWLAENAPGHLMAHDSEELQELFQEALEEQPCGDDDGGEADQEAAWESATEDLTYTESGYIPSWEWWAHETDRDELANFRLQYTPK